jgi:hypothetical protein
MSICCCLKGGRSSARQWNDILRITKQQGTALDAVYLAQWADVLGVRDLLESTQENAVGVEVAPFERMLVVHEGNSSVLLDEEQSLPCHRHFCNTAL